MTLNYDSRVKNHLLHPLVGIVLLGFLIRLLIIIFYPGHMGDLGAYYQIASRLISSGQLYGLSPNMYPYFPGWALFEVAAKIYTEATPDIFRPICQSVYNNGSLCSEYNTVIRLPIIIADVAIAVVIYRYLPLTDIPITKEKAALFHSLNPIAILVSAVHGQFDAIAMLLLILAGVYELQRQQDLAAIFLGFSILIKPIGLFVGLLFLVRRSEFRGYLKTVAYSAIPTVGTLLPFLFTNPHTTIKAIFGYTVWPYYGWFHGIMVLSGPISRNTVLFITAATKYLFVLVTIIYAYRFRKRGREAYSIFDGMMFVFLLFFGISAGIGIQYLYWVGAILWFAAVTSEFRKGYTAIAVGLFVLFHLEYMIKEGIIAFNLPPGWDLLWAILDFGFVLICWYGIYVLFIQSLPESERHSH